MRLRLFLIATVIGWLLGCAGARADTLASAENALLVIQTVDAVQTQTWLHGGRFPCNAIGPSLFQPAGPPKTGTCVAFEADPLARPFVGNLGRNVLTGFAVNIVIRSLDRLLFRHSRRQAGRALVAVDAIYTAGILVPNQRIIEAQK